MNIFFEHGISEPHVVECISEDDKVILPKNASLLRLPSTQPAMQASKNVSQPIKSHSQPSKTNPLHFPSKNIAKASPTSAGPNPHPKKIDYVDSHDLYESTEDSLYKPTKVLGDLSDTDSDSDDFNSRGPRKTDFREKHKPASSRRAEKVIDTDDSRYKDIEEDEPSDSDSEDETEIEVNLTVTPGT
ncbi:hypothetical protein Ahy_B08g091363 isoform B [Arachis hypogaea]|uniref:Uncharacterized protein n=1 Tax=Arachis hypogaea TaxID=3818 RepID=A0A444Y242_ARAHY|nr:hypothetical protein Ahy_B08g091363 isoform B [Arachis hypogaea]